MINGCQFIRILFLIGDLKLALITTMQKRDELEDQNRFLKYLSQILAVDRTIFIICGYLFFQISAKSFGKRNGIECRT